jgi:hypothetical protein
MKPLAERIIKAGLLVGTLDILAAFIHVYIKTGSPHIPDILKFIASGVFGKTVSSHGAGMVLAGLGFHYLIALVWTFFFFWLYSRVKAAKRNKIWTGIIFGIFVWAVMNLIVLPLSHVPQRAFDIRNAVINILILIVCIGIPLSLMAKAYDGR